MNGKGSADAGEPIGEALRLLNLFASVGAEAFDITHTNLQQEKGGVSRNPRKFRHQPKSKKAGFSHAKNP